MRDIKESYADAVDNVEDFLSDKDLLEEELWTRLFEGLEFWAQFENALNDASDNPDIENQLSAMDKEIKEEALGRVEEKYQIIEVAKVRGFKERIAYLEFMLKTNEDRLSKINSPDNVVSTFNNKRESEWK